MAQRGAALVWGRPKASGGGIRIQRLDAYGELHGTPYPAYVLPSSNRDPRTALPEAIEIAASDIGGHLGIAWVEGTSRELRAFGVIRLSGTPQAQPPRDFGRSSRPASSGRGHIAVNAVGARALVLARGNEERCMDGERTCVAFGFHRLDSEQADPRGLPLSVPEPCAGHSVTLVAVGERWHYGICSRDAGRPITTMFTIEYEPDYARAQNVLDGCALLGALSLDDGAVIVGDCAGKRRIARIRGGDTPREELPLANLMPQCADGRLTIGGDGFRLPLTEPLQRVEALLPDELAPRDARAVWTGHALLVGVAEAEQKGFRFHLRRYVCEGDTLRRTDSRTAGESAAAQAVGSSAVGDDEAAFDPFRALSCGRD